MGELHRWDKGRRRISWEQREAGEAIASGSKLLVLHGFLIILLRRVLFFASLIVSSF